MTNAAVLGTAVVKLETDNSGLDRGFASATQKAQGFGSVMKSALGTALGFAGAQVGLQGVGAAFDFLIGNAAGFEQALDGVQAATGATEADMESMRKEALRIGQDTSKSASEAVEAMGELAKAGMDVTTILAGGADAAVALAEATGIDVPRAAVLVSNAMNTWKKEGLTATQAANLFAKAANASAISVDDLGMSLAAVGPILPSVGMSMEDFAVAMGLMGNNAMRGSDAGTSLKAMLSGFTPISDKAASSMERLGFSAFDAQGNFKAMPDILDNLAKSLEGMTEEQRAATLELWFGSDGLRAANILLKEGSKGWQGFTKAMAEAPDVAEQARIRMGNFRGEIEKIKGTLETISITIGTLLLPYLTALAQQAGKGLGAISEWVTAHSPEIEAAIGGVAFLIKTIIELIATVAGPVLGFLNDLGLVGPALALAFAVFMPGGVFILAIGAVGLAIGVLRGDIETMSEPLLKLRLHFYELARGMLHSVELMPAWGREMLGIRDATNDAQAAVENEIDAIEDQLNIRRRQGVANEQLAASQQRATEAGMSLTEQLGKETQAYFDNTDQVGKADAKLRGLYDAYIQSGGGADDLTFAVDELTGAISRTDSNIDTLGNSLIGANYQLAIGKGASEGMATGMGTLEGSTRNATAALWGCVEAAQNVTSSAYAAKQMLGQAIEVAAEMAVISAATATATSGLYGPAYAEGGRPSVGMPAWVGERGPELFVPDRPGTILSHEDSVAAAAEGEGGGTTVNMPYATIYAQDKRQAERSAGVVGWALHAAAHQNGRR